MGSYRDIEGELRGKTNVRILILDTGNIQFLYQYSDVLPQSILFQPYDIVLIPGWVHAEYAHHTGKLQYVSAIPTALYYIDEVEDYLPMIGYQDKRLMELFRVASPFSESQRFFNQYRNVPAEDLPDDWIDLYYENGFLTRQTETLITKKNAGEVSILTLAFLLLSHYRNEISNISIATSDFCVISLKNRLLREANSPNLALSVPQTPPISYLSKDVTLFHAVKTGLTLPDSIARMRQNPKSSIYVEHFRDGSSTLHEVVVETPTFIEMCRKPHKYTIIF
ncbi:hypothetical protein PSTEL_06540 [Paenibacillus stellifer]|uniref:Uncharacterized protein n=2 Tax=Paenibacillus stellifer TaxID=169760 RepID=A0A089LMP0_9BACL|nr:hypothetical protein PSTEL_06540 [Paenibacillus stellifer]